MLKDRLRLLPIALLLAGWSWPAQALDDASVSRKLSTVPVLIPTDAAGNPQLA